MWKHNGLVIVFVAGMLAACGESPADPDWNALLAPSDVASPAAVAQVSSLNRAPSLDQLQNAGWSCGVSPQGFTVCGTPGLGRPPFPPDPDGRPHYEIAVFTATGLYLGRTHFIRADLYQGQLCAGSGQPYVFRPIGYYECFNPA